MKDAGCGMQPHLSQLVGEVTHLHAHPENIQLGFAVQPMANLAN